jgi:Transglutaminase-like superfamily
MSESNAAPGPPLEAGVLTAAAPARLPLAIGAWILLAAVDALLRLCGFDRFYRIIGRCPTRRAPRSASAESARVAETCAAIDRACVYYPKRAWCLQSAAATACFLRLRGIKADFVIGVQKMPFNAHAWAEVAGRVVMNDRPGLHRVFTVISRC